MPEEYDEPIGVEFSRYDKWEDIEARLILMPAVGVASGIDDYGSLVGGGVASPVSAPGFSHGASSSLGADMARPSASGFTPGGSSALGGAEASPSATGFSPGGSTWNRK